jgi:hypothetical protein
VSFLGVGGLAKKGDEMERELWSREDLRNAILATYYAGVAAQPATDAQTTRVYADGFRAALSALALQFGLPALESPVREAPPAARMAGRGHPASRIVGD